MPEDKKTTTKDSKEEPGKDLPAQAGEKAEKKIDLSAKDTGEEKFSITSDDGKVELPDDIKKKLEKRASEKQGKAKARKKKKKVEKRVSIGRAFIKATYNNTIVNLTDLNGNTIAWASAGMAGFKGPKKSTPYAAQIITRIAVEKAKGSGLQEVSVYVKGVGTGRESAVRALNANGLIVSYIKDITPIPHNGCRKRKSRRV